MNNTQFWESPEGPLAYDDEGTGPLVVCVPSMGDLRQEYRFLRPQLIAAGYRVVCVDPRGQGESTVAGQDVTVAGIGADLAGLLDHLNAGPARIVSDSMGAGASVCLAASRPDLVDRLVMMAPFVRDEPTWITKALYTAMFSGPWGAAMWGAYYGMITPVRKPADFKEYAARLVANLKEPGRLAVLRRMLKASKGSSSSRLSQVRVPVLVLMGTRDPDFPKPEAEARWVAEQLGGAHVMIEGAGHYPHVDTPDLTGSLIRDFLAK